MKNNSKVKISIITPSFNQVDYIGRTIDSVLLQKCSSLELIVIDGGSTDGTVKILRNYGKKIKWSSEKDKGQSDAINKGLAMCEGEVVGYLNSDDVLLPGSLKKISNAFSNKNVDWVTGKCKIIDEKDREIRIWISKYKNFLLKFYRSGLLYVVNPISQPATFWRRRVYERVGDFNEEEHLCMDYEYWLRVGKIYKLKVVDDYLAGFRVHGGSKSTNDVVGHFWEEFLVALRFTKNPFYLSLHLISFLVILTGYYLVQPLIDRLR